MATPLAQPYSAAALDLGLGGLLTQQAEAQADLLKKKKKPGDSASGLLSPAALSLFGNGSAF